MCPGVQRVGQRGMSVSVRVGDNAVLVDDNAVTAVQVFPELIVFSNWWGSLCLKSENPSSMTERRRSMLSSDDGAIYTVSQSTMCVDFKADMSNCSS